MPPYVPDAGDYVFGALLVSLALTCCLGAARLLRDRPLAAVAAVLTILILFYPLTARVLGAW